MSLDDEPDTEFLSRSRALVGSVPVYFLTDESDSSTTTVARGGTTGIARSAVTDDASTVAGRIERADVTERKRYEERLNVGQSVGNAHGLSILLSGSDSGGARFEITTEDESRRVRTSPTA